MCVADCVSQHPNTRTAWPASTSFLRDAVRPPLRGRWSRQQSTNLQKTIYTPLVMGVMRAILVGHRIQKRYANVASARAFVLAGLIWYALIPVSYQVPAAVLSQSHRSILESLAAKSTNQLSLIVATELHEAIKNVEGLSKEDAARYLASSGVSWTTNQYWFEILSRIRMEPPLPELSAHGLIPAPQMKKLRRVLRINEKVLSKVRTRTEEPDKPMFDRLSPSASPSWQRESRPACQMLSSLLEFEAAVLCQDGKAAPALESFQALMAIARSLLMEDHHFAHRTAGRSIEKALSSLQRFIEAKLLTSAQLALVMKEIESVQIDGKAQRSAFWKLCENVNDRRLGLSAPARAIGFPGRKSASEWWNSGADASRPDPLAPEMEWTCYVVGMVAFINSTREHQEPPESLRMSLCRDLRLHTPTGTNLIEVATMLEEQATISTEALYHLGTDIEIMRLLVLVEQYRIASGGTLPRTVEALIPGYMVEVPREPFNRLPLQYRILPDGYLIYSVGYDGIDQTAGSAPPPGRGRGNDQWVKVLLLP